VALRPIATQGALQQRTTQVIGERLALANGENPCLFEPVIDHRRAIAGGKDQWIVKRLQGVPDEKEAGVVERQASVTQPGRGAGVCRPDDLVGVQRLASGGMQAPPRQRVDPRGEVHEDAAPCQHSLEATPHKHIVGTQDLAVGRKEMKAQLLGVAAARRQFPTQPGQCPFGFRQRLLPTAQSRQLAASRRPHPVGQGLGQHRQTLARLRDRQPFLQN